MLVDGQVLSMNPAVTAAPLAWERRAKFTFNVVKLSLSQFFVRGGRHSLGERFSRIGSSWAHQASGSLEAAV